jgi:hypothetical protein
MIVCEKGAYEPGMFWRSTGFGVAELITNVGAGFTVTWNGIEWINVTP